MKIYRNLALLRILGLVIILASTTLVPVDAVNIAAPVVRQPDVQQALPPEWEVLNLHLDIPTGARIDYLRIFYYDSATANSMAWITTYDGAGGIVDLTNVSSAGASGYGTELSTYIGHIVDNLNHAYVLNWRPYELGAQMKLCGLRVAYRMPINGDWSAFHYIYAAGSTLLPRGSGVNWSASPDGGCVSLDHGVYIPLVLR